MRFTKHTGLKITPFGIHQAATKNRTNECNLNRKSFVSKFVGNVCFSKKPTEGTNLRYQKRRRRGSHIFMARTKNDKRALAEKSRKKRNSVSQYPFHFFEKNHHMKSLEGRFQKSLQTAIKGTEHTVTTDTGKTFTGILFRVLLHSRKKEKQHRRSETQ